MFGIDTEEFDQMEEGFEIFSKPAQSTNEYIFNDYLIKPRHPISHNDFNPVIFDIGSFESRHWLIPSSIRINLVGKITHSDGTELDKTKDNISLQDLVCHSLFQQIECKINGIPISDHSRLYQWRAIAHSLYSFQSDCKNTLLQSEGFYRDAYETKSDAVDKESDAFKIRSKLIGTDGTFSTNFIPRIDTLSIEKFFPPGHTLSLEFIRSPHHFSLLSPDSGKSFKIVLTDMTLECRMFTPPDAMETKLNKSLSTTDFHLPLTRLVCRTRGLHAGVFDGSIYNAVTGKTPSHMMIFLLTNKQLNGDLATDSYFFSPRNLKDCWLNINGQAFPSEKLSFHTQGEIFRSYNFFMKNMGLDVMTNQSIGISPKEYIENSFAIAFDLTPDTCFNNHFHNSKDCVIDIKLHFKVALSQPLSILYICSYQNCISVSPDKNVYLDYSV